MTYGDGVSDLDITALIAYHRAQHTLATLTAVQPPGRFGAFTLDATHNKIAAFHEKPQGDDEGAYINGGFLCLNLL